MIRFVNVILLRTNGIIQSIGMKLNEVDQDSGQKIQGLDQALRKTDNKCKDLENKITKFDINGSDQLTKIEEFGKTLQNLIDEKAKEKEEKKLQHSKLLNIQTDLNKKIGDLRNEFFNLHHDQVEKIKKVDDSNVTTKNSVDSMKVELKYLNSSTFKKGSFVNIDNEWKVTT
uniref:Viral A-type inclusion protein n=1 Tax=Meloidogyne javanica TaxID=6303 RepID=A0A915N496_MELJA